MKQLNKVQEVMSQGFNQRLTLGNYQISIVKEPHHEKTPFWNVAIISNHTGEFVKFKNIRKKSAMAKVKSKFSKLLCSSDSMNFFYCVDDEIITMINILKK